jgi:coproporphyrinogen III oxidase-like Fe-S oxidoreductase
MVYWNMEYYLGLWLSAASFAKVPLDKANEVKSSEAGRWNEGGFKRWTNTADIKQYLEGKWIDEQQTQSLNESDLLIEEFFLRLRTREGIADLSKFTSALVPNYEWLITNYTWAWLVEYDWVKLKLTDKGMNVYNSIITDLLQKI